MRQKNNNKSHDESQFSSKYSVRRNSGISFIISEDGHFLSVDPEICKMLGIDDIKLVENNFGKISGVNPANDSVMFNHMMDLLTESLSSNSNSNKFIAEISKTDFHDEKSNSFTLLSIKEIINEQNTDQIVSNADDSFQEFEFYKDLFINHPHPMWVYDVNTLKFISVNNSAISNYGYTKEEFLGMTLKDIRPIEDIPVLLNNISSKQEQLQRNRTFRHKKKDGTVINVEVCSHTITAPLGMNYRLVMAIDITDQFEAEKKLVQSEKRFRRFIDNAEDLIYRYDFYPERGFTIVNKAANSITGYSPEEHFADPDLGFKLVLPEDQNLLENIGQNHIGFNTPIEIRWIKKDGTIIHTEQKNVPIFDDNGDLIAIEGIARDITKRKQLEEALFESEERFRTYVDQASDALFIHDFNGKFIDVNLQASTSLGYSKEELLRMTVFDIETDFDFNKAKQEWLKIQPGKSFSLLGHHKKKDGSLFPVEVKFGCFEFKDERLIMGLVRDISERKKYESALYESQLKLNNIFNHSTNLFYSHDENHVIKYLSPQVNEILGYDIEEAMMKWTEFISDNPINKIGLQKTNQALKTGKAQGTYELELIHKNGTKVWVEVREAPVVEKGNTISIVGSLTDITERKRIETGLKKRLVFENTIASISSRFVNIKHQSIDLEINNALKTVGSVASVDRAYLFLISDDSLKCDNTHEWCSKGTSPQIDNLKGIPTSLIPWWMRKLKNNETIYIPQVSMLPPEASAERNILEAQDIKSVVVVPLFTYNKLKGFLGFDSVKDSKVWIEEDIVLLKMLSEIFVNALDRINADDRLRKSEESYRNLVNNAPDVIYTILFPEGIITSLNPVFEKITGWKCEDWIGKSYLLLIHPDDRNSAFFSPRFLSRNIPNSIELRIRKKNGDFIFGEFTNVPEIKNGRITGLFGIVHNITERKRDEVQLRSLMNRLFESEELMRKTASNQLHDQVGQNLTAITINLNYIISQLNPDSNNKISSRLNDSISLLDETIEQIRNIMVDLRPTVLEDYGLNAALNWSITKFAERTNLNINYSGIELKKELPINVGYIIFRVIQEIFHNISKHANAKNVSMSLIEDDHYIQIEIQDDGIGFNLKKIRQIKNKISFGLTSMTERMKLIGGNLEIFSEKNKGTRIKLEINR